MAAKPVPAEYSAGAAKPLALQSAAHLAHWQSLGYPPQLNGMVTYWYLKMPSFPHWKEEIGKTAFRQAVLAEFCATFIFIFSTIGCVVFTQDGGITTARQMEVALIFGNAITILIFIFAGISGANINPAVSFALALTQTISPARAICYAVAQCIGAVAGAGFVRIMTPTLFDQVDGGANEIQRNANSREALGVEFGCTALLVLVVMAATDSHRAEANKHIQTIAPIVIGMAVTAAHFIAIPVDNCSINPARSFGVSVVSGNFNDHWVFWLGPLLGAAGAAVLYKYVFRHPEAAAVEAAAAKAEALAKAEAEAAKSSVDHEDMHTQLAVLSSPPARLPTATAALSPATRRTTTSVGTAGGPPSFPGAAAGVSVEAAPAPLLPVADSSEWR